MTNKTKEPEPMAAKNELSAETANGPLIHRAMLGIMRDLEAIGKTKRNASQGFNYRGVDDVYNELHPLFCKHGVYMSAAVLDKQREDRQTKSGGGLIYTSLTMRYTFVAEDGSTVSTEAQGEGMDSGDKSSNKAMAVAHKYALFQAFCIPTEDMPDPDAESHALAARSAAPTPLPEVDDASAIQLTQAINGAKSQAELDDIWSRNMGILKSLKHTRPADFDACSVAAKTRKAQLETQQKAV